MTADRQPQREAETAVWRKRIADLLWWSVPGSTDAEAKATTADLLDKLIAAVRAESAAELAAVRAERDELASRARRVAVSHEHFIYDHSDPGTEALAAQYELVNYLSAMPGETELPLNPVENALRVVLAELEQWDSDTTPHSLRKAIAEFLPREDMSDRRRRIYVDGKGDGWIDAGVDTETGERDVAGITDPWKVASVEDVRDDTGSLREIGRCW